MKILIKSFYHFLNWKGVKTRGAKIIWSTKVSLKIRAFCWLVSKNAILTTDNLIKRKWHGSNFSVLCAQDAESVKHLRFSYQFSARLWGLLNTKLCLRSFPSDVASLWEDWHTRMVTKHLHTLWDISPAAACWGIWREHNNRIFK